MSPFGFELVPFGGAVIVPGGLGLETQSPGTFIFTRLLDPCQAHILNIALIIYRIILTGRSRPVSSLEPCTSRPVVDRRISQHTHHRRPQAQAAHHPQTERPLDNLSLAADVQPSTHRGYGRKVRTRPPPRTDRRRPTQPNSQRAGASYLPQVICTTLFHRSSIGGRLYAKGFIAATGYSCPRWNTS